MTKTSYRLLFLRDRGEKMGFSSPKQGGGSKNYPTRNRQEHGNYLNRRFEDVQNQANATRQQRKAASLPAKSGVYLRITGQPEKEMLTKSFDQRKQGIRMLNQQDIIDENGHPISVVIIYVPDGKISFFLKKIRQYLEEDTKKGNPKNARLLEGIEDIQLATVDAFWKGDNAILNDIDKTIWCEFWLRTFPNKEEAIIQEFRASCDFLSIDLKKNEQIHFPERTVLIGKTSVEQLVELLETTPHLAEIRPAIIPVSFLIELSPFEQAEFVEELRERIDFHNEKDISILVLDQGVNNEHTLLDGALKPEDLHTYLKDWGTNDHSPNGHGTAMSGLALLGDLTPLLNSSDKISVHHCLESGKIMPPKERNPYHLYGYIIQQVVSRAEIQAPLRKRIFCMAVTTDEKMTYGVPTSWSAAIDNLTSGAQDDQRRLFIISAGNVENTSDWIGYPDTNLTVSIEDPAQSWNAITVGAYTEKIWIENENLKDYQPIAEAGNLSPFSTTSMLWDRKKWPNKPDIVMEGGNAARHKDDESYATTCDDLFLLSIWHRPTQRQFEPFGMTSGATALAARLAAQIQVVYPEIWPETVRALIIHSAEWTEAMLKTFLKDKNKSSYGNLIRTCGFGVPDLDRATTCLTNRLSLVLESSIQPFKKREKGGYTNNEMEVFELPWPKQELLNMGEIEVELRITLSYFIEPGPGEIGWKDRYRYASHGLRFALSRNGEDRTQFLARINKEQRDQLENYTVIQSDRWLLGSNNRQLGSIHSDIWQGTAAEMATCNLVGIYPIIGWWRERAYLEKFDKTTRYSLVVSLKTAATEVDIYTPVAIVVETPIDISI